MNVGTANRPTKTTVDKAVADFIRHLGERNASPHTIKAYSRDLSLFAAYAGSHGWKQIDHILVRGFLSQLYEKGLSKTSVARALAAVRSLIDGWLGKAWWSRIRLSLSQRRNCPRNFLEFPQLKK